MVEGPEGARWHAGRDDRTTNNRMEMLAAIKGLEQTPPGSQIVLHSDSQYLVNTMTRNFRRNVNQDLWARLDALAAERKVAWTWVRGHAGLELNEVADKLAVKAAKDPEFGEQSGPLESLNHVAQPPSAVMAQAGAPALHASRLSHLDEQGHARMVDVSDKAITQRDAEARGAIYMQPATLDLILGGEMPKGDVFTVAQIAGVMAAKKTSDLIPLCHPLPLTQVKLEFQPDRERSCVEISATVRTSAQTGVEMEALTAVSAAALTIYDMCKAVDRGMRIADVRVVFKAGGKSGTFSQL